MEGMIVTHLAEVHTIYESNARSISDMLRMAADSIEAERDNPEADETIVMVAVQVTRSGAVQVYGWGETNDMHALGALTAGAQQIGSIILDSGI